MPSPERKRRRSPAMLRQAILHAAEGEFARGGFAATTTAAIAAAAGTTEAQIFRYFPSKAALFREAMVQPLDAQLRDFGAGHPALDNDHAMRASAYIAELIGFIAARKELFRSLVLADRQQADGIATVDALGEYFSRGAAAMARRRGDAAGIAPDLLVRISFAAVLGCELFSDWLYPAGTHSQAEIRAAVTRFVMDGLYRGAEEMGGDDG